MSLSTSTIQSNQQEQLNQDDFSEQDRLRAEFQVVAHERRSSREEEGSLYPDIDDSAFLRKLLRKREFRETLQPKITDETLKQNVCDVDEFEYTSSQKFVSQFMSPNTPYNGMLLYHGVGVGKTCTAILAAESFLELSPKNKVYILAPPTIQAGFYRTIFDSSRITFGQESNQPNDHEGCTGNRYLELTQTLFERDKRDIELRVTRLINKRYSIMGYVAFRNMVRDILTQISSTLNPQKKQEQRIILLQRALSGCLFIVDEAHNLRDVSTSAGVDDDDVDNPTEKGDAAGGKKLTPILREVLQTCEGNKLILMTATPMYNSYNEIISLLNLLLYVDKVDESKLLRDSDIEFIQTPDGEQLSEKSENRLIQVANGHVSFMRGENPKAFPARLDPSSTMRITEWPSSEPNGTTQIPQTQKDDVLRLPLVKCELTGEPLAVIQSMTDRLVASKGAGIRTIDTLLQAGNCIFPGEGLEGRTGSEGFQTWFTGRGVAATFEGSRLSMLPQYVPAIPEDPYTWMIASDDGLGKASPKFNIVLKTIRNSTGLSFVYSRFVENGAVILCLLLEANGYSAWGRSAPLFSKGPISGGRQCASCERKEAGHPGFDSTQAESRDNHKFIPAYYALLTASDVSTVESQSLPLSPNNTAVINAARDKANKDGAKIKVIVGSQVAGEGLDLRYIREVHILEGWFHLSKEEQIVGRGIRYCSHNELPREKRNCTIFLYANTFPIEQGKETIDEYTYRKAMNKAVRVGNVSRALKRGAADCNLNRDAILVSGLTDIPMIDSQGKEHRVDLNDKNYTPTCDWIRCSYECKPSLNLSDKREMPDDNGTYDMFAARFAEQMLIQKLKNAFKEQPWYHLSKLQERFKDIPKATLASLLLKIVNNQSILFENGNFQGHIIYRNNLFLFQPNAIQDNSIPISFRYGRYPMKRDWYEPVKSVTNKTVVKSKTIVAATVKEPVVISTTNVKKFWDESITWIDSWCKKDNPVWTIVVEPLPDAIFKGILERVNSETKNFSIIDTLLETPPEYTSSKIQAKEKFHITLYNYGLSKKDNVKEFMKTIPCISNSLSDAILTYVEGDTAKKNNIKNRLVQCIWFGKAIANQDDTAFTQLAKVSKQFIWDSFFKGPEQIAMLKDMPKEFRIECEQYREEGAIELYRYLDIETKEPIYICGEVVCAPSILKIILASKTDPVIKAVANNKVSANPYGFMVVWLNDIMFKTNDAANLEGKPPGAGAACSIISSARSHIMKLITLGTILGRYSGGYMFELTDDDLTKGPRKLQGAPSLCALLEIVLRWMDLRRDLYGGKRYFYRPLSSFYSKHKSKK